MNKRIRFVLYQSCGNRRGEGRVSMFRLWRCRWGVGGMSWDIVICLCVL